MPTAYDRPGQASAQRSLPPVQLTRRQEAELGAFVEQEPETLVRLAQHLESVEPAPLTFGDLCGQIEQVVGPAAAQPIAGLVMGLGLLCRRRDIEPITAVNAIESSFRFGKSSSISQDQWSRSKNYLATILSIHNIYIFVKASDLSFDYSNFFDSSRVIVDMRPVFDEARGKIVAGIISLIFRLEYTNEQGEHNLTILMDEGDVKNLLKACEDATVKIDALRAYMTQSGLNVVGPVGEGDK